MVTNLMKYLKRPNMYKKITTDKIDLEKAVVQCWQMVQHDEMPYKLVYKRYF